MSKCYPFLLAALLAPAALLGQSRLNGIVETKRFHVPDKGERVDVNITVMGNTATWNTDERGFRQARVQALTLIEQDDKIIDFRKTLILSPERADTLDGDFIHQERFLLQPGAYSLTIELNDVNSGDTTKTYVNTPLVVPARPAGVSISDIEFVISSKEGDETTDVPFPGTYFPPETHKLGFYAEAYGTLDKFGKDGAFIAISEIEDFETKNVAGAFRHVQRMKADTVVPIGLEFGIDKLPSGNYLLALELRDRKDSLVARQEQFFQRYNAITYDISALKPGELVPNFTDAITNVDTLTEDLNCLRPIADEMERKIIDDQGKDPKPELMRQYLYTFWYNRSPQDPEGAWKKYLQTVVYVNKQFGCRNMRGYQSDQGYVFLRYGAPNTVVNRANEVGVTPYMIWHYYRAGKYSDRRFVFIQQERSTTCWTLLTSDMPSELNNPNWLDQIAPGTADGGQQRQEVQNNYDSPH
ncbi:MAG: GWxTD domain-containing protein [Flavobacteriales bacterium]